MILAMLWVLWWIVGAAIFQQLGFSAVASALLAVPWLAVSAVVVWWLK